MFWAEAERQHKRNEARQAHRASVLIERLNIGFVGPPFRVKEKGSGEILSPKPLNNEDFPKNLVQIEDIGRSNDDILILDIDDKTPSELPFIRDRQFYLLVDMPLKETGAVCGRKALLGQEI